MVNSHSLRVPSPPLPQGWPLSWIKDVVTFPEAKLSKLRGVDATVYCRFIRGCCMCINDLYNLPVLIIYSLVYRPSRFHYNCHSFTNSYPIFGF